MFLYIILTALVPAVLFFSVDSSVYVDMTHEKVALKLKYSTSVVICAPSLLHVWMHFPNTFSVTIYRVLSLYVVV
jgi:hypothetical protein